MTSRVAGAVSRNPTFRHVSRTLRRASVRVSSIMGNEETRGRMRLDGEDDGDSAKGVERMEMVEEPIATIEERRPDRRPPEPLGKLRGKTLGVFGPTSRTRIFMDRLLSFP